MKNTYDETGTNTNDGDGYEIAPISLLIQRGRYAPPQIAAPGATTLSCGDRWPNQIDANSMNVTAEACDGELRVSLALRIDAFDEETWEGFAGIPSIVCMLATPPIAWFMVEVSGLHFRAPFLIGHDKKQTAAVRKLVENPKHPRSITLFGIEGDVVKAIKVGVMCDRVWSMFIEALDCSEESFSRDWCMRLLREAQARPPGFMFAEGMRRHLLPQRTSE